MAWPTETAAIYPPRRPLAVKRPRVPPASPAVLLAATAEVTLSIARFGLLTQATATTTLGGVVFYFWFLDGELVQRGTSNRLAVSPAAGSQGRIECLVSNNETFDAEAEVTAWPNTKTVRWLRSVDDDTRQYRVDQAKADPDAITDAELVAKSIEDLTVWATWDAWAEVAVIGRDAEAWSYQIDSAGLDDLGVYKWRIAAIDTAGNAGSATETAPVKSIHRPDAPDFAISFDEGTTKVTFSG